MSDSHSKPVSPAPEADGSPPAATTEPAVDMDELSDNDSVLSDVDEAQFADFDPANIAIEERPIAVDEDTAKLLVRHKRKRDGDEAEPKKKKKEGRREKPKKKRREEEEDNFVGGDELEGRRKRKGKSTAEPIDKKERARQKAQQEAEEEQHLDPEERRRRALDRAMDAALKNPNRRRKKADGIDLNSMADDEIGNLRDRMARAAEADVFAREDNPPRPAMHKLKLLPEVVAMLNRNGREIENAIVDPENNLLESVRFFLEPLRDGSLPAYNIQRELFAALVKLPIDKDALISSGIGKVILFYTKSKKPELGIKRQAERLLAEWTRPILKRSDDYRNRQLETRAYDPNRLMHRPNREAATQQIALETAEQRRAKALAPPTKGNRARLEDNTKSYTIVPQSQNVQASQFARPMGASGDDAFRRLKARQMAAAGKGPRRG